MLFIFRAQLSKKHLIRFGEREYIKIMVGNAQLLFRTVLIFDFFDVKITKGFFQIGTRMYNKQGRFRSFFQKFVMTNLWFYKIP